MYPASKAEARSSAAKFYFTGTPCKRGHVASRYTNNGHCVECAAEHQKRWWDAQPEGEKHRRWQALSVENREHRNAYKRAKGWKQSPEKKRCWVRDNPESTKRSARRYYEKNKPQFAAKVRRRAGLRAGAAGTHNAADVEAIRAHQKDRCAYCRVSLHNKGHVDHITALSAGGSNDRRNLQLLCPPCNLSKGAKHPLDFARQIGMLV